MNTEPKKHDDCEDDDQDEITAAHSIMMDIIEETESEDFGKASSDDREQDHEPVAVR